MLKWEKDINGYIGFEDDCPLYKVGEDDNGWYYECLPDADGMDGYDTCQEAMAAAESEVAAKEIEIDWAEEWLAPEELYEILGDKLYEERRDEKMGW